MMQPIKNCLTALACMLIAFPVLAQENLETEQSPRSESDKPMLVPHKYPNLKASAEFGFLGVLEHKIQLSQNNTYFDYVQEGGQDNLFNLAKLSLDLELAPQHTLVFLYQPLSLETQSVLNQDMSQNNIDFAKGTPMRFLYDFPFFRGSYLYDFDPDPRTELAVGASLQLRDAVIEFESLDGSKLVSTRNVGPVPILKFRSRHYLDSKWWWGSEVDGFYAPISILNGSTNEVIGAILDANLRLGLDISDQVAAYLNLRYISGGSVGTSSNREYLGDGYSNNWLHFIGVTLGMRTAVF